MLPAWGLGTMATHSLTTADARLHLDADGRLVALARAGRSWLAQPSRLWELTVQAPSDASVLGVHRLATPGGPPRIEESSTALVVHWAGLLVEGEPVEIDLTATIAADQGEFTITFGSSIARRLGRCDSCARRSCRCSRRLTNRPRCFGRRALGSATPTLAR